MKRFFWLLISLTLIAAMALPVSATETYTITIDNSDTGHIYEAYQIFSGTLSDDGDVLSDIAWGEDVEAAELIEALKDDEDLDDLFAEVSTASDVATVLSSKDDENNSVMNEALMERFTEVIDSYLGEADATAVYDEVAKKYTIANLAAGYYLVKDKDGSLAGQDDFYTEYIVCCGTIDVGQ